MRNSKHSLPVQRPSCASGSKRRRYGKTRLLACGRIARTWKTVPPGCVKCGSASGVTVLDTDIVVDALRDFTLAIDCLEDVEQQGDLRISRSTQMELLVGCRNRAELQRLERFLRRFTMLDLTESIGQSAVALLRQYRLSYG